MSLYVLAYTGVSRVILTHRLVYEAFKGEIPDGLEIDHFDRNKHNNNPDNLRLVTRSENNRNRKYPFNDFGTKFSEHFGIKEHITKHPDYSTEHSWYFRHNKKCRWEQ